MKDDDDDDDGCRSFRALSLRAIVVSCHRFVLLSIRPGRFEPSRCPFRPKAMDFTTHIKKFYRLLNIIKR
jgi:hypothetical protein